MWIYHFENVVGYHHWSEGRKAMEVWTLFDNMAATWYIQQQDDVKGDWPSLKTLFIQNFVHQDVIQMALQQLLTLKQQPTEPLAQYVVKINQLL